MAVLSKNAAARSVIPRPRASLVVTHPDQSHHLRGRYPKGSLKEERGWWLSFPPPDLLEKHNPKKRSTPRIENERNRHTTTAEDYSQTTPRPLLTSIIVITIRTPSPPTPPQATSHREPRAGRKHPGPAVRYCLFS